MFFFFFYTHLHQFKIGIWSLQADQHFPATAACSTVVNRKKGENCIPIKKYKIRSTVIVSAQLPTGLFLNSTTGL